MSFALYTISEATTIPPDTFSPIPDGFPKNTQVQISHVPVQSSDVQVQISHTPVHESSALVLTEQKGKPTVQRSDLVEISIERLQKLEYLEKHLSSIIKLAIMMDTLKN